MEAKFGALGDAFQFLIGRLETSFSFSFSNSFARFQFLIGRLETTCPKAVLYTCPRFQFLIGRLETRK